MTWITPLAVMCLSVTISLTSGLRCYVCQGMEFDSPNPLASGIFQAMTNKCNLTDDKLVTCPNPQPGNVVKCRASASHVAATQSGIDVTIVVTDSRCYETTANVADGCKPGDQPVPVPPGMTVTSSTKTNCVCSRDKCNNNNNINNNINNTAPTGGTTVPSLTRVTRPSGQLGLRCYVCLGMEFDSPNPLASGIFQAMTNKCNPTDDNLVTCPNPQPGNVVKCRATTSHVAATKNGIDVTIVVTDSRCYETTANVADGCKPGDQPFDVPPGMTVTSSTQTNCVCSRDKCNNNNNNNTAPTGGTTLPSLTRVTRPSGQLGLRCYVCLGMEFDSPNPLASGIFQAMTNKCNPTDDNLVTCPNPQPGNVVKCRATTSHVAATKNGIDVTIVVTDSRCYETTANVADGCKPGDQPVHVPPGMTVTSSTQTNCVCSRDKCNNNNNNNTAPTGGTTLPSLTRVTRPSGQLGLRCYVCLGMEFDSPNPLASGIFQAMTNKCNPTDDNLVTCPNPQPGNVVKCRATTSHVAATKNGIDVTIVVTDSRCYETTANVADGCKPGDQPFDVPPGMTVTSSTQTNCVCSRDKCNNNNNNNTAPTGGTTLPSLTRVTRPSGQLGLRCYVCLGMEFDSPNPLASGIFQAMTNKCNPTDDNLVTCPNPQPGNVVKCRATTSHVAATKNGIDVTIVVTDSRCYETSITANVADGCKPGDQPFDVPPGMTVTSSTQTNCVCSRDKCNNNNNTAPTGGLRCYTCSDVLLMSRNPEQNSSYAISNQKCRFTAGEMKTCPSPSDGYVAKCVTSTAHIDDTYNDHDRYGVVTRRSCVEMPEVEVDGCKDDDKVRAAQMLSQFIRNLGLKKYKAEGCYCSHNQCNNKAAAFTRHPNEQSCLKPALTISAFGLILAVMLGIV